MSSTQNAPEIITVPSAPFPQPARGSLDTLETDINDHVTFIRKVQQLNTRFPMTNDQPPRFSEWIAVVDRWVESAADLLERIGFARDFIKEYDDQYRGTPGT